MKYLVIVVFLFASTYGATFFRPKIVGGYPIEITQAPYQVALLLNEKDDGNFVHNCGGSIIHHSVVVTAAHCTDGTRASQWKIRAGSSYHNKDGQVIDVFRYVQNDEFNSKLINDICLLHLTSRIQLSESASNIVLPSQALSFPDGTLSVVTGWGWVSNSIDKPDRLYRAIIPIANQEQCIAALSPFGNVTSNMVCAGNIGLGGVDFCDGDDGGPLAINGILFGIASWGYKCGEPQYPGVYTRVSMYRNWIEANM